MSDLRGFPLQSTATEKSTFGTTELQLNIRMSVLKLMWYVMKIKEYAYATTEVFDHI